MLVWRAVPFGVARSSLAAWMVLTVACAGGSVPAATSRSSRADLTTRLCELLPPRAHECVVSWPGSVAPRRRAEVMSISEAGPLAGSDSPVRAYASCVDRGADGSAPARVSVLLLAERPASRGELAAALPIAVRWAGEPCEADTCALPVARLDGDRLVLTRRGYDAPETSPDLARLACGAVRDGAVEARATTVADGTSIREVRADERGVEVRTRRRGHASTSRERFDWAELGLRLVDIEISREAAARAAAATRVQDVVDIDVTNEGTVELQVLARERRLARDPSDERLGELAELLARAYAAHPSRTDLGVRAVERAVEARALGQARETLALLASLVEPDTGGVLLRLRLALALAEGDAAATRAVIADTARGLDPTACATVAARLLAERGDDPIDQSASITLSLAARGLVAIARREAAELRPTAGRPRLTLRGAPAALAVLGECRAPEAVVICGAGVVDRAVSRVVTPTAGTLTLVGRAPCLAGVSDPASLTELPHVVGHVGSPLEGDTEIYVSCGDDLVGISGAMRGAELTVTRISRRHTRTDLALVERWLAHPFASLDGRVFPAPTLTLPVVDDEADAVLAAARSVEGARCAVVDGALECSGALAAVLTTLYASFAAD